MGMPAKRTGAPAQASDAEGGTWTLAWLMRVYVFPLHNPARLDESRVSLTPSIVCRTMLYFSVGGYFFFAFHVERNLQFVSHALVESVLRRGGFDIIGYSAATVLVRAQRRVIQCCTDRGSGAQLNEIPLQCRIALISRS